MRIPALILFLAALTGAAAVASGQDQTAPPLKAGLATCQTGADPAARYAVFTGSMPAMAGARTLAMRFELLQRLPGGSFKRVTLAKWGVWEKTSRKGVPGFIFTKRVEQLAAPAAYRARIDFRWSDAAGKVLRAAQLSSPICLQPDPRPDLVPRTLTGSAINASTARYTLTVRNTGRGDAPAFAVSVAGAAAQGGPLPAGAREEIRVRGPRCRPGTQVEVTVDAPNAVDEAHETNNATSFPCPLGRR